MNPAKLWTEMERKADLRRCAADLLVAERAKELLLEGSDP